MPDFDVEAIHSLLTEIADGKRWEDVRGTHAGLSLSQFNELTAFVRNCQAIDRNAWKTWSQGDIRRVTQLNESGVSVAAIARELGRSEAAVEFMLKRNAA